MDDDANVDNYPKGLYDMFEVFTAKNSGAAAPIAATSTSFHPNRPGQYKYQATAEDKVLTKQVMDGVLQGKLDQITPAHIFAISPPIRKGIVERLRPRRVESAAFEQVCDTTGADPVSVLEIATKREAEYSLPLREINVLVNGHRTEAGVLDQGSQIVVIQEDLANEVGARINTQRVLRMEGANGSTSRTL